MSALAAQGSAWHSHSTHALTKAAPAQQRCKAPSRAIATTFCHNAGNCGKAGDR